MILRYRISLHVNLYPQGRQKKINSSEDLMINISLATRQVSISLRYIMYLQWTLAIFFQRIEVFHLYMLLLCQEIEFGSSKGRHVK